MERDFNLFPSRCYLQQNDYFGLRNVCCCCLVFGFFGISPLTQLDHQNTSENYQRSAYLNCRALKYQDQPAHYSNSSHPFPPSQATLLPDASFFTSAVSNSLDRHFLWVGPEGKRHSWAKHLHFLSLLTAHCLGLFLFYTLLLLSTSAQGLKFRDYHCCVSTTARITRSWCQKNTHDKDGKNSAIA